MSVISGIFVLSHADEAGRLLVDVLRLAVAGVAERGRADLIFTAHLPVQEGDDWNRVLQLDYTAKHSNPTLSERTKSKLGLPQQQPAR